MEPLKQIHPLVLSLANGYPMSQIICSISVTLLVFFSYKLPKMLPDKQFKSSGGFFGGYKTNVSGQFHKKSLFIASVNATGKTEYHFLSYLKIW